MSSGSDEMRYAVSANVNVGNFVTVRPCLEGDINGRSNFKIWKEQMLCLLDSQGMAGFEVDGELDPPIKEEWRRRDRLVKGWILGSIGKDALDAVWDQPTARSTWLLLHRFFDTSRDSEHEHENGNEHEHENENENEIEHENHILGDFEHKHDNSNGALRFQSEHDNDKAAGGGDADYSRRLALYKAAQTGDWRTARIIFNNKRELCTAIITSDSETALHVAVSAGRANFHFVRRLVELMPEEALAIKDSFGKTALHNAAIVGNITASCALLEKNPHLLYILSDGDDRLPVLEAAINCRREALQYLIDMHEEDMLRIKDSHRSLFEGRLGIQLLNQIIASQFVDIALDLVYKYPNLSLLTNEEDGTSALSSLIAATYTLFRRRESLLQRFVYHCIPVQRLQFEARPVAFDIENLGGNGEAVINTSYVIYMACEVLRLMILRVVEFLVPRGLKELKHHQQALQLAQRLCYQIVSWLPEEEALEIFKISILVAAKYGVREIAEMIIEKKPSVIHHVDPETGMNIFHLAASLRHENVFNLIYSMSDRKYMFFDKTDYSGNNLMHICGKLAPPASLDLVTGPALQMQREIQWFKEMESFVNPSRRTRTNKDGLTPQMLFSTEHKSLRAEGEEWMKNTSNSCTVAATLIATVMFASAFTVPGGLESTTGVPLFAGQTAFSIFAIADTISLFTSVSSVLAFLSIATSRYAEEDFLYLTRTLSVGMLTLFISILFMLVAFGVALYLVPYAKMTWFVWVLAAVAVLPVTQFVLVLFPLLVDVVSSSYGPGIFGKTSNRVLY